MKNKKMILVLILFIITIFGIILARYKSKGVSSEELQVAYYVIGTEYQTQILNLNHMVPREEPYNYNIAVTNEQNGIITETAIEYTIQIKTTTNIPLRYTLYNEKGVNQIENTETIQDEEGVYYIKYSSRLKEFGIRKEVHKYKLAIEFPIEYKANSEYSDIIELVEITVDSKQKI